MKTLLLFFLLSTVYLSNLQAQNSALRDTLPWAPQGATWIYNAEVPIVIKYMQDSLYEGKSCKLFTVFKVQVDSTSASAESYLKFEGNEFLYQEDGVVYIYDNYFRAFKFLEDMGAEDGDIWADMASNQLRCFHLSVAIGYGYVKLAETEVKININSRYVAYKDVDTSIFTVRSFIPNIGKTNWFFPTYGTPWCNNQSQKYLGINQPSELVCYTDDLRGKLVLASNIPTYVEKNRLCENTLNLIESSDLTVGVAHIIDNKNGKFSIYPNPAQSQLNIYTNGSFIQKVKIYDTVGRLVLEDKSSNQNIDISTLNTGMYLIHILDDREEISIFKLIKG